MASFCETPEPGDLIEIFHIGYKDWAIYVGDGYVIHLAPPSEFLRFGSSKMFTFLSRKAVVAKDPLEDVTWGCFYRVNNRLDHQYRPRPIDEIISSAKKMIGDKKTYKVLCENSEDFVTDLRYGWPRCKLSCQDPQPGDLIAISRAAYKHWAIYMGDGNVVHLNKSGIQVVVKQEPLKEVVKEDEYWVSNYLDCKYKPRPVDEIISLAKKTIGKKVKYNLLCCNCEHFATELRYGRRHSNQVRPPLAVPFGVLFIKGRGERAAVGKHQRSP
ncbi:phospholipase A and acyltransferase 4-like isoform X1 [Elephas maximus indicus]|uniref:phospholipase A and acyltransferase 4-like isoform X1 n=2 Tax=Elephas maximus indicus TaxID=99487 RepID=UPI002116834B|nr:phospholipase A and acyltransferase 4-like isoform X1 [Elephas maximus indicus]XP_049748245.1 phospholipase A and acyltransferase 4-like isoform X1 [Elephas maximus indicus]XP_049748246.1 phospholipase A and acyltransferase 4-like isoform X1 [Elephas maximus indicus]